MDEVQIHDRIQELVAREHSLRDAAPSEGKSADRTAELQGIEAQLDQCWDLLRQRQAKKDAGADPDDATVRSVDEVEGYRQ